MTGRVQSVYTESLRAHNGRLTDDDAERLIDAAKKEDKAGSSGWLCCAVDGTDGTNELKSLFKSHGDRFEAHASARLAAWLKAHPTRESHMIPVEPGIKTLVDTTASHRTWHCDWFPMARRADAPGVNLYSDGGVCSKYDRASGRNSVSFEKSNHASGVNWAGHCDMAARACCLLAEPTKAVNYNGVTFSPHDIQGLLVMVSNDLAGEEPFLGSRYNGNPGDDASEPYPHVLMPALAKWAESKSPYVLDIDNGVQVWNYAFDKTKIKESDTPQGGMTRVHAPNGGRVKYQTWDLSGAGYDAQARSYRSWVEYASDGKMLSSGWFGDPSDTKRNPDFAWKPVARGDLSNKANWPTACTYNPEVDPQVVFEIYHRSI